MSPASALDVKSMAVLPCRHCGGQLKSDSRRSQCPHCGALFPFVCAVSGRNLRPPLIVFDDERHITFTHEEVKRGNLLLTPVALEIITSTPLPLSDEHHLRLCPEDTRWFLASENPNSFLCPQCAQNRENKAVHVAVYEEDEVKTDEIKTQVLMAPRANHTTGLNPNLLVSLAAAASFIGLVGWFLLGRF